VRSTSPGFAFQVFCIVMKKGGIAPAAARL
jgi:hypothetical protein